jgi:hypothetical protein
MTLSSSMTEPGRPRVMIRGSALSYGDRTEAPSYGSSSSSLLGAAHAGATHPACDLPAPTLPVPHTERNGERPEPGPLVPGDRQKHVLSDHRHMSGVRLPCQARPVTNPLGPAIERLPRCGHQAGAERAQILIADVGLEPGELLRLFSCSPPPSRT